MDPAVQGASRARTPPSSSLHCPQGMGLAFSNWVACAPKPAAPRRSDVSRKELEGALSLHLSQKQGLFSQRLRSHGLCLGSAGQFSLGVSHEAAVGGQLGPPPLEPPLCSASNTSFIWEDWMGGGWPGASLTPGASPEARKSSGWELHGFRGGSLRITQHPVTISSGSKVSPGPAHVQGEGTPQGQQLRETHHHRPFLPAHLSEGIGVGGTGRPVGNVPQ